MTIQAAVFIKTLIELGQQLTWFSYNIFSTQNHAAAYLEAQDKKFYINLTDVNVALKVIQ